MLEVTAAQYVNQLAVFRRFEVSEVMHTVRWENDADLAPEYLHQKMVEQSDACEAAASSQVGES